MHEVNRNISLDLIEDINIERYIKWLFKQRSYPISLKEKAVIDVMQGLVDSVTGLPLTENEAKIIVYEKTYYWKPPSQIVKKNFSIWRANIFDNCLNDFNNEYNSSALSKKVLAKSQYINLTNHLIISQKEVLNAVLGLSGDEDAKIFFYEEDMATNSVIVPFVEDTKYTDKYRDLAKVCGTLDFIKYLKQQEIAKDNFIIGATNFISWKNLFKDPNEAERVLAILKEEGYINVLGEWIKKPLCRYLMALCTDLEDKGYFISGNSITNPQKAKAFNKQFSTDFDVKNWQPEERSKANDLKVHFGLIPVYSTVR